MGPILWVKTKEGPDFDSNSSLSKSEMILEAVAGGRCLFVRIGDDSQRYSKKRTLP